MGFHIMYHGIGEVLAYLGYFVLFHNHFDLLYKAIDHDEQKQYRSDEEHSHLKDNQFIRIVDGSLYTFGEVLPNGEYLGLHFVVKPDKATVFCKVFYIFIACRIDVNRIYTEMEFSEIYFVQLFSVTRVKRLIVERDVIFVMNAVQGSYQNQSVGHIIFRTYFGRIQL